MIEHDVSVRPMPPRSHDAGIARRERSWTLIAGSHRLSFTRIDHQFVAHPRRALVVAEPARRWSLTGMVAVVLGMGIAMATLGLALNASRAATGVHYALSIPVPAVVPFKPIGRHRSSSPAPRPVVVTDQPAVAAVAPPIVDMTPSDTAPAALMTMRSAIDAAMKTGALQQWASADGAEHGFVVAGPAEQGCRTLSILTRRDGGNQVTPQRECIAPAAVADGAVVTP